MGELIVGLTGGMCSGKNSFGDYLVHELGTEYGGGVVISSSDAARAYIEDNNLGEPTRDLTRETATQLRQQHGDTYMVDWALGQFEDSTGLKIVAGLYIPAECERIREVGGVVVAVHAQSEERQKRMNKRSRAGEEITNDFSRLDKEDMHATNTDQRLGAAMTLADIDIYDPGTADDCIRVYRSAANQILNYVSKQV